jgi:soluble cytochrome b562
MSRTGILSLLLIAAFFAAPLSLLSPVVRGEEEKKVQKTELHKKMEVIDEGMKKLKNTLRKPAENPASLKTIGEIIDAATACKDMTPSMASKMPEADRKKFVDAYRESMTKLIDTMGQMKTALEAGDNDKAKALHKALKDQEEAGHDKFVDDDSKDAPDKSKADKADK